MNKYEYTQTMKKLKINLYDKLSPIYSFENLKVLYDYNEFAAIHGTTPHELAKLIYEKYAGSEYDIRNRYDRYEAPIGNVSEYHIYTIKGLVAFLLETYCYNNNINLDEKELNEYVDRIYETILVDCLNSFKWFNIEKPNNKIRSVLDYEIEQKLKKIDDLINPYDSLLNVEDNNYEVSGGWENNGITLRLYDKKNNVILTNSRSEDEYLFKASNISEEDCIYDIIHSYNEKEEKIVFVKYEFGMEIYEYNLTDKTYGEMYKLKHPVTTRDRKKIINKLDNYITLLEKELEKNKTGKQKIKKA